MKKLLDKRKSSRFVAVMLVLLLAACVLAGTVFAVTLDDAGYSPVAAGVDSPVGDGSYIITVNTAYADAVNDSDHLQTVEIYNDTSQAAAANGSTPGSGTVTYAMPAENSTPTLNVKSNGKVSVTSVQVLDENGNDITTTAFGSEARYEYFIESTKSSLFGYFELYNVTGDITVNVTYGEPVTDIGTFSGFNMYSATVVTKGDVGPYNHVYANDERKTASVVFSSTTFSNYTDGTYSTSNNYGLDTTYGTGMGNNSFTYGNYYVNGNYSKFVPSDGGQITRYCYGDRTVVFDNTNYSYIADLKAYYNDTGEDTGWDFSNLIGQKVSHNQAFTYTSNQNNRRSVTFVVTYSELPTTTVFTRLNNHVSGVPYSATLSGSCPNGNALIIGSRNDYYTSYGRINDHPSYNPLTKSQYSYNQFAVVDSDTVRISATDSYKTSNSVDFSNIKVYALDVDNAAYGEEITNQLTITYSPARNAWGDDGYVDISGLKAYGGNIYVEGDTLHYNMPVRVQSNGAHTDSFTITSDVLGAIGSNNSDSSMQSAYTQAANVSYADRFMYGGGTYNIKSDGSQSIYKVVLDYYSNETGSSTKKQLTFDTVKADGSIDVELPTDFSYVSASYSSYNKLTVYYTPVETLEAQVYATSGGVLINNSYSSIPLVEVTTYDGADNGVNAIFNTNSSGASTAYQSLQTAQSTSLNSDYVYTILPEAKVKVKNVFVGESRNIDSGIKDFVNRRLEFKGVKVYKASNFRHDGYGTATVGDEITVTRDGDYYVFTMPTDSGVRVVPEYEDHIRTVNILANDPEDSNSKNRIDKSTRGTATLVGDEGSYFVNNGWAGTSAFNSSYHSNYYFKNNWSSGSYNTLDGSSFTLTVTPVTEDDAPLYKVKSVKAYKYDTNSTSSYAQYNHINTTVGNYNTFSWLTFNGSGEVTSTEIPNVVGELNVADEATQVATCSVTLPSTLDVGNIVLYVEFEEAVEKYAPLAYANGSGTSSFKPRTVFSGDIKDNASGQSVVTDGAEINAAFYKAEDASPKEITMTIGGDNSAASAFYHTNLIYTVKSYDEETTYGAFRLFEGEIKDVTGTVSDVVLTNSLSYVPRSSSHYATADAVLTLHVPEEGLKITCQTEVTYIPVTFKQKILQSDGTVTDAGDTFTATVTKYNSGFNSDIGRYKYFTKEYTQDYLSLIGKDAETYYDASSFTVTGAQEKRNMAIPVGTTSYYYDIGYYVAPSAPEGYMLAGFKAVSLSSEGDTFDDNDSYDAYFNRENKATSLDYYTNPAGYRFEFMRSGISRGSEQVVEICYAKKTTLTVDQYLNGMEASGSVSTVDFSNNGGTLQSGNLTPFVYELENGKFRNTFSTALSSNTSYFDETNLRYHWNAVAGVNAGTVINFTVNTKGAHNIAGVRAYKLVDGEEQSLGCTRVSGTGYVNSKTVYQLDSAVASGDDIHIEIVYGSEQTLTVEAKMYDASNNEQTNNKALTKYEVNVTGEMKDGNGNPTPAFKNEGDSAFTFSEFTTDASKTVSVYSSTKLYINTDLVEGAESSEYVVANVKLFEGSNTTPVGNVTAKSVKDDQGKEIGKDYSECTVNGLTPGANTKIVVYLAKTSTLTVSAFTYNSEGELTNGVPHQENVGESSAGSYVNVRGISSINSYTFVTQTAEGQYTTGDFMFAHDPHTRTVTVLQNTQIEVFTMLPDAGDWVVSQITGTDGFAANRINRVETVTGDSGEVLVKTTVGTTGTIYPDNTYEMNVLIDKGKKIRTYSTTDVNGNITKPNGTVKVIADDVESGKIPFTQMYPNVQANNTHEYTASSTSSSGAYPYTTIAKCLNGTKLHLRIVPDTNFGVKSLTVRQGGENGELLQTTQSGYDYYITPPAGSDSAVYTMPKLSELYINVVFTATEYSRVYIDYQYVKNRYVTSNLEDYFGLHGDGYILAQNSNDAYNTTPLMNQVEGGYWADPDSGTRGELSGNSFSFDELIGEAESSNYFKFDVINGTSLTLKTNNKDSAWLTAVELWVTDGDGKILSKGVSNDVYTKFAGITVQGNGPYTFHARFVENSRVLFRTVDLNCYDNVREEGEHVLKDSEFGGLSAAATEGSYHDIEDVELTDMYEEHMMTVSSKYYEATSGNIYDEIGSTMAGSDASTMGPLGFEGDRESMGRSGIDDFYYPNPMGYDFERYSGTSYSSWKWQSSRDCTALDGTSLINLNIDTSKMRTPWNTPVSGNGSLTTQNRNQSETINVPSGWDVVARIYRFDKTQTQLTGVVENISPSKLNKAVEDRLATVVETIDLTRNTDRKYKTSDYENGIDNYDESRDYLSHDMTLELDPQYYYMVVVKYEQIHVYTDCNTDHINTYFATLHYHSDTLSPYSQSTGLEHDHDIVNYNDIEEAFVNSEGSTGGKLLDTRIPLYYGRPGDNYVPGRDSAIASPNDIYNSWYKQTYFVMVSDVPKEELSITNVTFYDYRSRLTAVVDVSDPTVINDSDISEIPGYTCWANSPTIPITSPADSTAVRYRTIVDSSGFKRYQYLIPMYLLQTKNSEGEYVNTFGDTVLDNTLRIKINTREINVEQPDIPSIEPEKDTALLQVSQYDRISPGNYELSMLDSATVSEKEGNAAFAIYSEETPVDELVYTSSVTLPEDSNQSVTQLLTTKGTSYFLRVTPRPGYVLEKIVETDSGTGTYYPKDCYKGIPNLFLLNISSYYSTLKIYYAHPILRVTANNTTNEPKGAVDVYDTGTNEENSVRVLESNEYMKETDVGNGDLKTLKITPEEYTVEENGETFTKRYTVQYISVGDAYDNLVPIYDETKGEPNLSQNYTVTKDPETGVYTVQLKEISSDTYVYIHMVGETVTHYSNLIARHHIKLSNATDYVNCDSENTGGVVGILGVLSDVNSPFIDESANETNQLTLPADEYSISASVQQDTALYLDVVPPAYFKVDKITAKYGSDTYNAFVHDSGDYSGKYGFGFTAPESGTIYVDVYYSLNLTDYKLVYKYKSRFVNEGDGNYEDGKESAANETDKEYVVNISKPDTYFKDGKPIDSVLIENAPAIDDLYKNCRWIIDSSHVQYDTDNSVATITAYQPVKQFSVKFYKSEQEDSKFREITVADRNSFAKVDDEFVTADPEITVKSQENEEDIETIPFAYWKIEDADSPIKNDKDEIIGYKEIEKCFSLEFNYRITKNIRVIPYYSTDAVHVISISDPEFTREQYTDADGEVNTDLLYADFILSYFDRENMILFNGDSGKDYETGLLLEFDRSIKLDKADESGATLSEEDAKKFDSDQLIAEEDLKKFISNDQETKQAIESEYTDRRLYTYSVNNASYNNKNRADKALSFKNTENFRHYVFRAYYYVINPDGTVELSAPVYFYLYDIGNLIISDSAGE